MILAPTWPITGHASCPGSITQTSRTYTGQIRDGTGLMFSNVRSYDPRLGRFLIADTVVSRSSSGMVAIPAALRRAWLRRRWAAR